MTRKRTIVALEFSGEWLKLAQVAVGTSGKRLVKLFARTVERQEELSTMVRDLVKAGMIPTDSVVISIPRNVVTIRNLQLPTTDHDELKEMITLRAAKQTPYSKDEIIADFQVVGSGAEGYTDVVLVITHRSVSNRCLNVLDEAQLKAEGIRLGSEGVLSTYRLFGGSTADDEGGPVALVDVDDSFSDLMVVVGGETSFSKALSIGAAKVLVGGEKEIEKLAEEIERAVDLYENEQIGERITKVVITGAEVQRLGIGRQMDLIGRLRENVGLPIEHISVLDNVPPGGEVVDLPVAQRGTLSFSAVLGLAWNPEWAKIDLTPQEVRSKEALAQKGKAIMVMGMLVISILMTLMGLISHQIHVKKQYLKQLEEEVLRTEQEANEVEAVKRKMKSVRDMRTLENSPLEILSVLHKSVPSAVYLKAISFEEGSHLILKGVSQTMSTVFEFRSALEKEPNFKRVKTKHVSRSRGKGGAGPAEFEIRCVLAGKNEV